MKIGKSTLNNNHLLAIATVLLLTISYRFAISNTIMAWKLNKELKQQVTAAGPALQQGYTERKAKNIGSLLAHITADTTNYRERLLNELALAAEKNNVRLTQVFALSKDTSGHILTQKLVLEGNFYDLIRFSKQAEQLSNLGMVRSLSIRSNKNAAGTVQNMSEELYMNTVK